MHFILRACAGELIFSSKEDALLAALKSQECLHLPLKKSDLKNVEQIDLNFDILSIYPSFRPSFISKGQHALELVGISGDDTDMHFLISTDPQQIQQWLEVIGKAKIFSKWYQNIHNLVKNQQDKLTEQINAKLLEILQFCD